MSYPLDTDLPDTGQPRRGLPRKARSHDTSAGMGRVYLAYDALLDRMVAVKFISAVDPNSEARERFLIEARAAARLQHPNVAAVYRVGELDGHPYIITEFIRGATLDTLDLPVAWRR